MNRFQRICCSTVVGLPLAFGGVWSLAVEWNAPVRTGGVTRSLADPLDEGYAPAHRARQSVATPMRRLPPVDAVETQLPRVRDAIVPGLADTHEPRGDARPFRATESKMDKLPAVDPTSKPKDVPTNVHEDEMWDNGWTLAIAVALLGLEWLLRKRWRLV